MPVSTTIPGVKACHAIISDVCRANRGDDGAIDEALRRIRAEYDQVTKRCPVGNKMQIHVAIIVEHQR